MRRGTNGQIGAAPDAGSNQVAVALRRRPAHCWTLGAAVSAPRSALDLGGGRSLLARNERRGGTPAGAGPQRLQRPESRHLAVTAPSPGRATPEIPFLRRARTGVVDRALAVRAHAQHGVGARGQLGGDIFSAARKKGRNAMERAPPPRLPLGDGAGMTLRELGAARPTARGVEVMRLPVPRGGSTGVPSAQAGRGGSDRRRAPSGCRGSLLAGRREDNGCAGEGETRDATRRPTPTRREGDEDSGVDT